MSKVLRISKASETIINDLIELIIRSIELELGFRGSKLLSMILNKIKFQFLIYFDFILDFLL